MTAPIIHPIKTESPSPCGSPATDKTLPINNIAGFDEFYKPEDDGFVKVGDLVGGILSDFAAHVRKAGPHP